MSQKGPNLTLLGWLVIFIFIGGCGFAAYYFLQKKPLFSAPSPATVADSISATSGREIEIGIAYGTEKKRWLEWAAVEFAKTPEGRNVRLNLIPMGSVEGAQAILAGDQRIHVWSPASALYKDVFVQEWNFKHGRTPILHEEALALSPMVFVMWAERYDAFIKKYQTLDFQTIAEALRQPGGWDGIAAKPEWGLFKFSHAHPNQSNSGLMTLTLMAYSFSNKTQGLSLKDILNPDFQTNMLAIENTMGSMSNSTGNMMRDMVLRGPSTYDCIFVYENVVIDYLKNAEGRWGSLRVVYPHANMWNENPYYVLDAPWSSASQRKAAESFLDFLLTEPVQREALKHGFRPGNPAVPIKFPESPFVALSDTGLKIEIGSICEPPKAEVLTNLLEIWQRGRGAR